MQYRLILGDCLEMLKTLPNCSIDAIVTDPPAGIAFMGKGWDKDKGGKAAWKAWMQEVATECLRVIKPGGHALVWAIPRTSHWTGDAWEDAGWQPRDKIYHAFGSGFPKSLNVGKSAKRDDLTGWGTALKPAIEEWWLFRKPIEGTVANNILKHGTGAINIDGCRADAADGSSTARKRSTVGSTSAPFGKGAAMGGNGSPEGRFPANLIHDGSDEVLECFPERKVAPSGKPSAGKQQSNNGVINYGGYHSGLSYSDSGSAARFFKSCPNDDPEDHEASRLFYCGKATKRDRDEGLERFEKMFFPTMNNGIGAKEHDPLTATPKANIHPTVKATALMRYLCRLITPPGGIILDPFTGSGSTGKAAILEGFQFVGIEQDVEYLAIARARIKWAEDQFASQLTLDL